jgi:hypothetical protein
MRLIFSFVFFLIGCASHPTPPAAASSPTDTKNYVSLDLDYSEYKSIYDKLVKKVGPLKNRGEAHVTLITPPEFKVLTASPGTKLTPEKIHAFFKNAAPSEKDFSKICIGRGLLKKGQSELKTYYVVLKSDRLRKLREELSAESGLSPQQFDPDLFFPHITLGFTERDLFYEDGVIKTAKSCSPKIQIKL